MKHVRKRFLAILIAVVVLIGVVPNVFASNGLTFSITPSKETAKVGEEVTYTISVSNADEMNGVGFNLVIPEGMTYKKGSAKLTDEVNSNTGIGGVTEYDDKAPNIASVFKEVRSGEVVLATFICTVNNTGNMQVTADSVEVLKDSIAQDFTPNYGALSVFETLTSVTTNITAPTTGDQPVKTLDTDKFTGTVTWSGNPTTFEPVTKYTATVTLVPKAGFGFSEGTVTVKVNSTLDGKVTSKEFNKLVFTVAFPETSNKINVSETITFKGSTVDYDGTPKTLPVATSTDENKGSFTYTYVGVGATEYELSTEPPKNAGTYEVTAIYNSSLTTGTKKVEMVIAKILPTATEVATDPALPAILEYNKEAQGVEATPATGVEGLGTITLAYNGGATAPTIVGTYEVTASFDEGANYKATTGVVLGTLEITKKSITGLNKTIYVKENLALAYTNQNIDDLLAVEARESTSSSAIVVDDSKNIVSNVTISQENNLVISVADSGISGDVATIKLVYDSPLYEVSDSIINIIVTDKEILAPEKFDIKDKVYDGEAAVVIEENGVFVNIITDEVEKNLATNYIWSTTIPAINAGDHFVEVTATTDSALSVGAVINSKYLHFTIEKAPITFVADDVSININNDVPTLTFTVDGLISPDNWETIKATEPILSTTDDTTTVGEYPINIEGGTLNNNKGGNYSIENYKAGTLTVENKSIGGNGGTNPYVPSNDSNNSSSESSIIETVTTPPTATSNIVSADYSSKVIKSAVDAGKIPEINVGTKDGVDFYGSDLNSIIDNNLNLTIKKGTVSITIPTSQLLEYNVNDNSKVRYMVEKGGDSFISKSLSNKLKSIDKINEKLLNNIYYTTVTIDGKKILGKQPQSLVSVDVSSLNLNADQGLMLTGIYYDGVLDSYIQLGGELSKNGKIFTFHMPYNGNFGLLVSDNIVKLKFTINSPTYILNGKTLTNDVSPVIENDRTILPLRAISEALGANVSWEDSTRTVVIRKDLQTIKVPVDSPLPKGLGTAKIINDRTFVPVRYVAEELGANVVWDANTREVSIYK